MLDREPCTGKPEEVFAQQQVMEVSEWPQTGLFDDLVQLGDDEKAQLRQMLEAEQ